jgi:ribosome recycling factor
VAIRGVRRDGMEQAKGWIKKHDASEDEVKQAEAEIQKLTDQYVKQVDAALVDKEKDIRTV